ncbi:MAG: prepilin-type N-terminal cleavage/methylation domain-containing protein [Desulfobacterales bacterium]
MIADFFKKEHGFTMIELTAVLILAGIIAAAAASVVSRQHTNLRGRAGALESHIRYARALAMSTDEDNWGVRFDMGSDEYWLFHCQTGQTCGWDDNKTRIPGTKHKTVDLKDYKLGISSTSHGGNTVTLAFDNFGTPYWAEDEEVLENRLENSFTATLSDNSANTRDIKVIPVTGAVP